MKEIWKDIDGFENIYQVSNLGRVCSKTRRQGNRYYLGKILKPSDNGHGYLHITLANRGKRYQRYLHRLVAQAFLPNPYNYPEINHKDENTKNNQVNNLEWCTAKYNSNYKNHGLHVSQGSKNSIQKHIACIQNGMKTAKPVIQLTLDGQIVKYWASMGQAAKQGKFRRRNIRRCCEGEFKQYKGYKWQYAVRLKTL